ncbi:hypothetical protein [Gemmobacter sp. 24YEA27]|uniref:hypothetical protein n=1 Tax=Gemmobacter sp. 24YEA27 TaxID=3040672 RepID=UPI0024B3B255|nr:hypothetical protein [Gemmobacter sp. 24YEA27]
MGGFSISGSWLYIPTPRRQFTRSFHLSPGIRAMRFVCSAALLSVILSAAIPAVFSATPALAQEEGEEMEQVTGQQVDGWIRLESDGESHEFMTVSFLFDTVRVGTASVADGAQTGNESIVAVSGGQEPDGGGPFFHLAFGWPGEGAEPVLKPEITWYPAGQQPPFFASLLASPPEVTVTRYAFDGQAGAISGSFSGRVCSVTDWDQEEPDPALCRDITGAFETKLHPAF